MISISVCFIGIQYGLVMFYSSLRFGVDWALVLVYWYFAVYIIQHLVSKSLSAFFTPLYLFGFDLKFLLSVTWECTKRRTWRLFTYFQRNGKQKRKTKRKNFKCETIKSWHQSWKVFHLSVLEHLELKNFPCRSTLVANNIFTFSKIPTLRNVFHWPWGPTKIICLVTRLFGSGHIHISVEVNVVECLLINSTSS